MAENKQQAADSGQQAATNASQIFDDGVRLDISMKDLFGGDLGIVRAETAPSAPTTGAPSAKKGSPLTAIVLFLNVLLIAGLAFYFVRFRPIPIVSAVPSPSPAQTAQTPAAVPAQPVETPQPLPPRGAIHVTLHTAEALEGAISLQTARQFVQKEDFYTAAYVYEQLQNNVTGSELEDQCLRDWLCLQVALCLQKTKEQALMGEFLTKALQSKSMVVRTMANYSLALIQMQNHQFLEARSRAFQAISLLKTFENSMPETMEADCYFLAAESLTRYLLQMSNQNPDLPASGWSDSMIPHELPVLNQEQLSDLLVSGLDQMNQAAIMPKVAHHPERHVGSQWSVNCIDAPLEQLLWQYASETKLNIVWDDEKSEARRMRSTLFMPYSDRRMIGEVITGSVGLIWRYDGQGGTIYDPAHYRSFSEIQNVLAQEAISVWQRFLLHYGTDARAANAHYSLGRLFGMTDEFSTALGEYKLVSTQYYGDDLAPYAMLDAGKIKSHLLDYEGAREDLNELLIRYPNCKVADAALLFLAEATMKIGLFEEAAELFDRAWRMNIGDQDRCAALYGLGRCAYEMKDYKEAVSKLSQAMRMTSDQTDSRLGPACFLLGRSYVELNQYAQASGALKMALGKALDNREYVEIIVDLVEAECLQENYMQALCILESVPERRLNQEETCRILVIKARIYRDIDLPDTAISVLRRRIEFIAEAPLRAMLTVELAKCYLANDDLTVAKKELNDALYDLPVGLPRQECYFLLAQTCFRLNELAQAQSHCLQAVAAKIENAKLRSGVFGLLGQIYSAQQLYDKAALAYAGVVEKENL